MDHELLSKQIRAAGLDYSLAEIQGIATGMSCAHIEDPMNAWQAVVFAGVDPNDVLAGECRTALLELLQQMMAELQDIDARLPIILPDEGQPVGIRAAALAEWVQGFLFGFGLAGDQPASLLSGTAGEVLRDFGEISRLDIDIDDQQEAEESLMELEEYLWVAATLVYQDVQGEE